MNVPAPAARGERGRLGLGACRYKGLQISYNLLNLPRKVVQTGGSTGQMLIDYTYGGERLRKQTVGTSADEERLYLGGAEYVDGILESYLFGDGRLVFQGDGSFTYQYLLKDHLGNTVVLFTGDPEDAGLSLEVLQATLYYPFGMPLDGLEPSGTTPRMDYLYNGKELDEELGLEWLFYGFRTYDAAIGRWVQVDPLAMPQAGFSPYHYVYDNPLSYWDPLGLFGSKKKAERKRKKAIRKLGADRVGEVYYNEDRGGYGFMVYGEGADKYVRVDKTEEGLTVLAYKGDAIYSHGDWVEFKKIEGLGGFISGYLDGFRGGATSTLTFFKSLNSVQGWRNLGKSFYNLGNLTCLTCLDATIMRAEIGYRAGRYIENLPNMNAYEIGYDFGYGSEKIVEAVLVTKGVTFTSTAIRFGLGEAMWQSSTFGPRSFLFGRYHSQYVPFGRRGVLNKGLQTGVGWSSHNGKHVFRLKYKGIKFLDIYK